ncbi:Aldehyde ferredoxin oxidoreductase [Thermosinus carboxydivorans Nor1]|uniref:Aldehyde ferredoxin oxidoreductase n=1 Tax=Thermosinus carboxydivorans Nor1 TaxID=401526 RepID=A1HS03_9FIRM|nr:aldehyde ferredoxin oxidoreductase family protein [Thermosinus carboxydivorans]EAX47179.1 Aldehyde ferredoxin oxidoreductase [Thermosinus carboxydivorans Nor1]
MPNGYMGKILEIDLTSKKITMIDTDMKLAEKFVGGRGMGAKYLWDRITSPGLDPLSPENPLMFWTGPLTGTAIPGPSRITVCTKSANTSPLASPYPHASTVAWSCMGGQFAPELKFAGYDGIIITGKSDKPVYIVIDDAKVEIKDAAHLWGKSTNQTDLLLQKELGPQFRTLYIGPAGENLVKFAAIISESSRAAGRSGVGCVMGSKKLKAIAVRGTNVVPVADPEGMIKLRKEMFATLESWNAYDQWRRWGTASMLIASSQAGTHVTRNFREGTYEQVDKIGAPISEKEFWVKHRSCYQCPLHCMKIGQVTSGPYKGTIAEGPEYETGTMHGSNCLVTDLGGMMKSIELADDLGLDSITTGNILGFLMELYEKGIVTRADLDGIDMKWGNIEAMLAIQQKIAKREGVGDILAEGVKKAAAKFGQDAEKYAIQIKGQELAAWNIPANHGFAIVYGTSNRGACHQVGPTVEEQHRRTMCDTLVICRFPYYGIGTALYQKALNVITGWKLDDAGFFKVAERIWNLEKVFNAREGFRRADDYVPKRFTTEAFTVGPKKGAILPPETQEKILDEYYTKRGWDVKTSLPGEAKLKELGLEDLVPVVQGLK